MIFNIHPTNQKTLTVENLQLNLLFQNKLSQQPQEETLLRQQLHTHSYAEVFACLEGMIEILDFDGQVHLLQSGDLAIVPSGAEHVMLSEPASTARWIGMGITFRKISAPETTDLFSKAEQVLSGKKLVIYRHRSHLCKLIQNCHQFSNSTELSTLLSFLAEFIKLPAASPSETRKRNADKAKNIDRLLKLDDIINMNFSQNFSNAEIADLLFISKRQLSRIVEKNYGEPLRQILLKRRLQGAAELLKTSKDGVEKIAATMGFTNKNTFFREFKKQYGCTPLTWRKKALDSSQT